MIFLAQKLEILANPFSFCFVIMCSRKKEKKKRRKKVVERIIKSWFKFKVIGIACLQISSYIRAARTASRSYVAACTLLPSAPRALMHTCHCLSLLRVPAFVCTVAIAAYTYKAWPNEKWMCEIATYSEYPTELPRAHTHTTYMHTIIHTRTNTHTRWDKYPHVMRDLMTRL